MPRWLFLILVSALALAVVGSALIALRGGSAKPPVPGPAAGLSRGSEPCPAVARAA